MTDVRFYHLQKQTLDQALPAILQKAYQTGKHIQVCLMDDKEVERMNKHLWAFKPDVFLPHGTKKEGTPGKQPIWLSSNEANENKAKILILTQGKITENVSDYDLCCEMLDGRDVSAVEAARTRWKEYQSQGHDVTYWFQSESGGWEKKA